VTGDDAFQQRPEFKLRFNEFLVGSRSRDNARSGVDRGGVAAHQRAANADQKLAASARIDPTDGPAVEPAGKPFELPNARHRRFARYAANRRGREQLGQHIEQLHALGQCGAHGRVQVLHVGEFQQGRPFRVRQLQAERREPAAASVF